MIKLIIYTFLFISLFSCQDKKMEFIQSNVRPSLYLIKNPAENDSILKKEITKFLLNNNLKIPKDSGYLFYRYTLNTKYFLKNKGDYTGGFSSNEIAQYKNDEIASFIISKCKNNKNKLVGQLHFFGNDGLNSNKIYTDTIIWNCN